jgi:predicted nuclease with TOPRIM domain
MSEDETTRLQAIRAMRELSTRLLRHADDLTKPGGTNASECQRDLREAACQLRELGARLDVQRTARAASAEAQLDAILAVLPPDPRDGVDPLDRVTNLVARVQHAETILTNVAKLEAQNAELLSREHALLASEFPAYRELEAQLDALTREHAELQEKLRASIPEAEHLRKELYIRKQMLGDAPDPKHPPTAEMARLLRERVEQLEAQHAKPMPPLDDLRHYRRFCEMVAKERAAGVVIETTDEWWGEIAETLLAVEQSESAEAQLEAARQKIATLHKHAKALSMEDAVTHAEPYESETQERLRWFIAIADLRHEKAELRAQVDALTRAQADLTEQKREISYVCHDQSDRLVALTKALEAARAAIHGEYCGSQHHTQCEAVTAALAGTTKVAASGSRGESVTPKGALAPPLDAAISAERVTVDALTAALRALVNGLLHDHAKYPQLCLPEMQLRRVECLAVLLDERGSR